MHVGTQLKARSENDYRVFAQLGVNNICGFPNEHHSEWTATTLTQYREYVESFGLNLDMVQLPLASNKIDSAELPAIMLGTDPQRDRDIEHCCNIIRMCAAAGIPAVKYNLTILGVVSSDPVLTRGGAKTRSFNYAQALKELPDTTIAGLVDADTMWERINYFIQRVVPVADEYKIRMALHPHDPGVPSPQGLQGVDRVLGSVEGMKKFISLHPSDYHGFNFCQGTVSEMLENPGKEIYEVIRYFGERKKIFNVHFRNITGGFGDFEETFIDNGDGDMHLAAKAYHEVNYPYMIMPDHVPHLSGENEKMVGFAYTYGYIKSLIKSVQYWS